MSRFMPLFGLALSLSVSSATGAAAQRDGFIVGFGVGPSITTGNVDFVDPVAAKVGVAMDFRIGAVLSDSVQLYHTIRSNFVSDGGALIAMGLGGLGFTVELAPRFDVTGAAGVATWIDFDWDAYVGLGLGAGLGYEFADRWVLNLGATWGTHGDYRVITVAATIGVLSH